MVNYKNGKIYKIVDNTNGNIYIGSTANKLSVRLSGHKTEYKLNPEKNISSGKILKNNDFDMELIEYFPCNNKLELETREQYYLDTLKNINTQRAVRTREQYYQSKRASDKRRTRDYKPYLKNYRDYRSSWGGDPRSQNNLLLINTNLFD